MKRRIDKPHWGEVLLVANPISGIGRAARRLEEVTERLRSLKLNLSVMKTSGPGDAERAARDFVTRRGVILVFGGDGTFSEVLNGAHLETCTLGLIPAGAGNVFAKEIGLSWNPREALEQVLRGRPVRFDVGLCNGRRFACMFGAGFDGAIVRSVTRRRKGTMTHLRYIPSLMHAFLVPRQWDITVRADDRLLAKHANVVIVGNTHSYGGPMELTPCASAHDELLDIMAGHVERPGDIVELAPAVLMRKAHLPRKLWYARCRRVSVTSSVEQVPYQLDGDLAGCLPAEVSCQPAAARILVPPSFKPRRTGLPLP